MKIENLLSHLQGLDTGAGTRVHESLLPQSATYPAIAVTAVQSFSERDLSGAVIRSVASYRLDVYGDSASQVYPVSRALREALDGYRGYFGTATPTRILLATITGPADFSDEDGNKRLRHHILELELIYSED